MIRANKKTAFNSLFRPWVGRILRCRFHGIFVAGGEHLEMLDPAQPVIGCVNHTNWWDGFVLYVLSHRRLRHDIYLAMDEHNLRRYGFFTWMGVFGVDLSTGATNIAALRYVLGLLRPPPGHSAALVWVFVQGALVSDRRPVLARPGASFLAKNTGALLLPLTLRYAWLGESRPSVFIRAGEPLPANTPADEVADHLNRLLALTDATLDPPGIIGYVSLFPPRKSIHTRWDDVCRWFRDLREIFDKPGR